MSKPSSLSASLRSRSKRASSAAPRKPTKKKSSSSSRSTADSRNLKSSGNPNGLVPMITPLVLKKFLRKLDVYEMDVVTDVKLIALRLEGVPEWTSNPNVVLSLQQFARELYMQMYRASDDEQRASLLGLMTSFMEEVRRQNWAAQWTNRKIRHRSFPVKPWEQEG